jgi:fructan beta-fructosidase
VLGYDPASNRYFIDRRKAGNVGFNPKFAGIHWAPRLATGVGADLSLYFDAASVELFADQGLSVMTSVFFPNQPFTTVVLESKEPMAVKELTLRRAN